MPFLTVIIGLFTGPFGKIFTYGSIILAVVGGSYGYLKYEEHEAVVQAEAKWQAAQAAQVAKDNAANAAALQEALTAEEALQKQVDALNSKATQSTTDTNVWIAKQKASGQAVDPIFNQTLTRMRGK
jgi:hypothetical protein